MVLLPMAPLLPEPHIHKVPLLLTAPTLLLLELICAHVFAAPICVQELRFTTSPKPRNPDVLSPVDHSVPSLLSPIVNELPPTIDVHDMPVVITVGLLVFGVKPLPKAPLFCPHPQSLLEESIAKAVPLPPLLIHTST